jgi:hypothetical protein
LTGLQGRGPSQGAIDEALALHERLGKLLLKASQLDPVTNLPRYGPETVAKMQRLTDEAAELLRDLEEFAKKQDTFVSKKAKEVLFDPWLQKIYNERNGIQKITSMFQKR